jgi:hypothetical protein
LKTAEHFEADEIYKTVFYFNTLFNLEVKITLISAGSQRSMPDKFQPRNISILFYFYYINISKAYYTKEALK